MSRLLILFALLCLPATAAAYTPPAADSADGWPVADAAGLGWDVSVLDALEARIADQTYPRISAVLVAAEGRLVYEGYFNGAGRDTLNDMRSASKSITALLIGAAIGRGQLRDEQAKVYGFFRDLVPARGLDPRKASMTLQDLLSMSSAWECDDENAFSSGNEERMYVSEHWLRFALVLPLRGYAPWQRRPADSPYGRTFSYCTAGSFVLGAVLERATGQPLAEFARSALEQPLGITQVQWNRASEGTGMGGGGTRYRARDMAKFGELLRTRGSWQQQRVLAADWIDAMLTPRAVPRENVEYGYQMWRFRFAADGGEIAAWAMSGNGGNYVFVVPQQGLVALIATTAYNNRDSHPRSQAILRDYLLKAMPAPRAAPTAAPPQP